MSSYRAFGQDNPDTAASPAPAAQAATPVTISQQPVYLADKYHPMSGLSAHLTGAQALPPNQTASAGNMTVAVDSTIPAVTFQMELNTLSSPITAIRVFKGEPGSQGELVKVFNVQGTNLTSSNPNGTNNDVAAAPLPQATGTFTLGYQEVGQQFSNYTSQISQGQGANGMPSGVTSRVLEIVNQPVLMTTASAVWSHADQVEPFDRHLQYKLAAGQMFVEVDTQNYPNGEIRGQIT
ncbi:MAG: CHRD domain-containing protein, partial [Nevskia sp.]|nr:CHRD domain-containing protein [Nevskia sp.]